jgi:hypothetical protein
MDLTPLALMVAGVLTLVLPWLPGLSAWEPVIVRGLVAFLCFYLAAVIHERRRMGRMFRELLAAFETFNAAVHGKDHGTRRRAIDYLIEGMASDATGVKERAHAQLVRLTGVDLGDAAPVWRDWWQRERNTFTFPAPTPPA